MGGVKSKFLIDFFRASNYFSKTKGRRMLGFPVRFSYKFISEFIFQFELKDTTKVGDDLKIFHGGRSTVIHPKVVIGNNVSIRHNTTIGGKGYAGEGRGPIIGNNVDIGANVVIIGAIYIGDNAVIGAGSVVVKDVPENAVVAGNPAKVLRIKDLFQI